MFESLSLSDATEVVRDAAAQLLAGGATALSDDDLVLDTAQVEELGRLVDAMRLACAGEIGERSRPELGGEGMAARRGCRKPGELLERLTLVSGSSARARLRTAAGLRGRVSLTGEPMPASFPLVADAIARGDIGIDAATAIVTSMAPIRDRVGVSDDLDAAEAALVASALGDDDTLPTSADELRIMAQTWALYLDPDGTLPDEERALRARSLSLGRLRNGTVPLRGELLPEVAAQLQLLFDAFNNPKVHDAPGPRFHSDTDDGDGHGTSDDVPADPRTSPQRTHDSFAGVIHVASGFHDMPLLGGAPPTLVVTVTADQLARPDGVAFVPPFAAEETGAVSAVVARHSGCVAKIQRIVFDEAGKIVDLRSPERIFTPHQRRAIAVRDGECILPGCHVPAAWAEVHHVIGHALGGPTHTDNGVLLCWWHHRTIETSGWLIQMIDGVPWVRAPRWLDPSGRWRPAGRSASQRFAALADGPSASPPVAKRPPTITLTAARNRPPEKPPPTVMPATAGSPPLAITFARS